MGNLVGISAAIATLIGSLAGGFYKLKHEQNELASQVNARITKVETDLEWVAEQTRHQQEFFTHAYFGKRNTDEQTQKQKLRENDNEQD